MELTKGEQELILKMREEKSEEKELDIALTAYKNGIKSLIEIVDRLDKCASKAGKNTIKRMKEDEFYNIYDFIPMTIALDGYREYFKEDKGKDK